MEPRKIFKSESGSALVQLLVGLGILSIVGLSAAHITVETKKVEMQGDTSNAISQVHLMAIQKSRNLILLKKALGESGLNFNVDSEITRCLSANGLNCDTYNSNDYVPINGLTESIPSPGGKMINNGVHYKLICVNPTACHTLLLRITTSLSDNQIRRTTDLRFPGSSLVDRVALSFSCVGDVGGDNVITGIDFQSRRAVCQGIPVNSNCSRGQPIVDLDAGSNPKCANLTQIDCNNGSTLGLKSAGLMAGQGTCL